MGILSDLTLFQSPIYVIKCEPRTSKGVLSVTCTFCLTNILLPYLIPDTIVLSVVTWLPTLLILASTTIILFHCLRHG